MLLSFIVNFSAIFVFAPWEKSENKQKEDLFGPLKNQQIGTSYNGGGKMCNLGKLNNLVSPTIAVA